LKSDFGVKITTSVRVVQFLAGRFVCKGLWKYSPFVV
jgi:hypothetical protein